MQPSLFDAPVEPEKSSPPDQAARDFAIDPAHHVVIEASAGTGKTRVLVDRYVRLIEAGVDPRNILAMTFTRKAAAEMRDRILAALRAGAGTSKVLRERWSALKDRAADIQISTIDAFCFSLLREFPLEARVDPAFEIADETEMARFAREALDLTLRAARGLIASDENVRLLFARVKLPPLRDAIQSLIDRRHVALPAVHTFIARQVRVATAGEAADAFVTRVRDLFAGSAHRRAIVDDGPLESAEFLWLHGDLAALDTFPAADAGRVQQLQRRLQRYFVTDAGKPRAQVAKRFPKSSFASADAKRRHEAAIKAASPAVVDALERLASDVNGLLARGLARVLVIAAGKYEALLDEHAVLDFAAMLAKAVALLERQEEFARSRLKLQSRYHHVLVDEFQDTSRLQWRLVEHLIDAWREGEGPEDTPTSIFVVGDRKQSIYRFRHAEVALLDEVARKVGGLRPGHQVRQAITHSFRAVPELLAFVNALCSESLSAEDDDLDERFRYGDTDRFPVGGVSPGARRDGEPVLGIIAETSMDACARAVAAEVDRLLRSASVRTSAGVRHAQPDDIAILFRARTGHQYFEEALEARGIQTYVYKGLGFFDAPEVQDLQALLRYLAAPESHLRAAELLRSRLVRVSDVALAHLAPGFADALRAPAFTIPASLPETDAQLLLHTRRHVRAWLDLADRVPPSELIDTVLHDSAYAFELRGRRRHQARENLKKMRALVRRVENRGYATLGRLADYFETLRSGDESNATIEAAGCVNLMTIHAAKGLEFPIVFVVNLHAPGRGRSSAFSVIERGPGGEPEVAFGTTDATRLEDLREREELRRLLYVAVTRAKDRLYLAAEVEEKTGKLRRGTRSLASLLPLTLGQVFGLVADAPGDDVQWVSQSGAFAARVCRPQPAAEIPVPTPSDTAEIPTDVAPLTVRRAVVAPAGDPSEIAGAEQARPFLSRPGDDHRLVGTLVHRLLQRFGPDPAQTPAQVATLVPSLIRPGEGVDVDDLEALAVECASLFLRLSQRTDVQQWLASGACYYEVPFSFIRCAAGADADDVENAEAQGATVVRGRIDCVVDRGEHLTILEFKTGSARPEHEAQISTYVAALRKIFPSREIDAHLIYP